MTPVHVLAASHGTDNPHGQQQIHRLRGELERLAGTHRPGVQLVFHEAYVDVQQPRLPEVLAALPAGEPAVVLPLLVADGVHTTEDISEAVGGRANTTAAAPLGALPALARVLAARAAPHLDRARSVVLAAAGTRLDIGQQQIRELGALLAGELGRPVLTGYCAGAQPRVGQLVAEADGQVLVLSALLAEGYFQGTLRSTGAWQVTSPLLPDVTITQCFLERLFEALDEHPGVTKYDKPDGF